MAFKKLALAAFAAIALACSAGVPAQAQYDRDGHQRWINIVNQSGVTIREFYMTDVGTSRWGDDRLGEQMIEPGEALRVVPNRYQRERGFCRFDMLIVFTNGSRVDRRGVNLCQTSNLVCTSSRSCHAR